MRRTIISRNPSHDDRRGAANAPASRPHRHRAPHRRPLDSRSPHSAEPERGPPRSPVPPSERLDAARMTFCQPAHPGCRTLTGNRRDSQSPACTPGAREPRRCRAFARHTHLTTSISPSPARLPSRRVVRAHSLQALPCRNRETPDGRDFRARFHDSGILRCRRVRRAPLHRMPPDESSRPLRVLRGTRDPPVPDALGPLDSESSTRALPHVP